MSEVAAKPPRRRGRGFDLVAMLVIGLVIVAAGLLPAVTANSGGTVTVRGDVTVNGAPLAFFPVGFWTTDGKVPASTRTDANGRFTLDVSDTLDGYAFAGTHPDSTRAILPIDGRNIVRGVMSTETAISPIYQGRSTSTAKGLFGGAKEVHFRLQEAGRITGTSPIGASGLRAVQVRRADNSVVQTLKVDGKSRFSSMLLTPGQYGVALIPKSPGLPTVANAIVRSGATTSVRLTRPTVGATVLGTVRAGGKAVGGGVPVLLEQEGEVLDSTTTASDGSWSFAGVAAGDIEVEVGRFDAPAATTASASSVDVQIPGASPSPTPTAPTATPQASASATPTTPEAAAVAPVERTADAVLPQTFPVTVPTVLGEVNVGTDVRAAGRLTGFVTVAAPPAGTESAPVQVVVEEASTQRVVRVTSAAADGKYSGGGLLRGRRCPLAAVPRPEDATLAQMGTAVATARSELGVADIIVNQPALTLSGTVAGASGGRVTLGDPALLTRTASIDDSGAYALQGLVPGAFPVVVTGGGREASEPVGVVVQEQQSVVDLQQGPRSATFKGWFIASGAGILNLTGTATDADGDQVRFGPDTDDGHVTITGLRPGTYTYDPESFRGSAPTVDGPWYYQPPTGGFTLSDGATTDVYAVVLHVRTH